jgi:hypothetical protein
MKITKDWLIQEEAAYHFIEWAEKNAPVEINDVWPTLAGHQMVWLLSRVHGGEPWSENRKKLVPMLCEMARFALPNYESKHPENKSPRKAIETVEAWVRGEATQEEVEQLNKPIVDAFMNDKDIHGFIAACVARTVFLRNSGGTGDATNAASIIAFVIVSVIPDEQVNMIVRKYFPTFPESL